MRKEILDVVVVFIKILLNVLPMAPGNTFSFYMGVFLNAKPLLLSSFHLDEYSLMIAFSFL